MQIVPLMPDHLPDAARLVATSYRALRRQVPVLPERHGAPDPLLTRLADYQARFPGVAAIDGSKLTGFLVGCLLPDWRGRRSVYVPAWASAALPDESCAIYQRLYAAISERWVANGCLTHLLTLMADGSAAHGRSGRDTWHWLGFGLAGVDAIRDLSPPGVDAVQDLAPAGPWRIRRATVDDLPAALALDEGLWRHLAAPPTFLAYAGVRDEAYHRQWLADPANALWLAFPDPAPRAGAQSTAVAGLGHGPASPEASFVVGDEGTTSITSAYTRPELRGSGLGTALLDRALAWARSEGYQRCAVDFEPENTTGGRFRLRYFQPVTYSFARCIDPRIAWGHAGRDGLDMW
jgi:GNAT superfamily N-acetyltransferase